MKGLEGFKFGTLPQEIQPEGIAQKLARVGTATGLSALKGVESLASFIPETVFGLPHQPTPSEMIQKSAGLTNEYLAPQSVPEKYIQRLAQYAPVAATGGLGSLARTAIGAGAATGVGEAGFSEPIQDIAQLFTELAVSPYQRGFKPFKTRSETIPLKEKLYETAKSEVQKIPIQDASNIESFINKELNNLSHSGLDESGRKLAKSELKNLSKDIPGGKITADNLWESKKHINSLISGELSKKDPNKKLVQLYERTVGTLNKDLDKVVKEYPKFGVPFSRAEDYYKGLDTPGTLRKALEKSTNIKQLFNDHPALTILSTLGAFKSGHSNKLLAGYIASFPLKEIVKSYELFTKSKQIRDLGVKIAKDIAKDSVKSAINTTLKMNKLIQDEEISSLKGFKFGNLPS